jgi:hypothetical protein
MLLASDPDAFAKIIEQQAGIGATGTTKDWLDAVNRYKADHPGVSNADMIADKPELADATTFVATRTADVAEKKQRVLALGEAKQNFGDSDADFNRTESLISDIKKIDPKYVTQAVQQMGTTGFMGQVRQSLSGVPIIGMDPQVASAAAKLDQLHNILYSEGWKGRGRITQQEAGRLQAAFDQLSNKALSGGDISGQLDQLENRTVNAHANLFGAAGQPTPQRYWDAMSPIYKDKGPTGYFNGATPMKDSDDSGVASSGAGGGKMLVYNPKTGRLE